MGDSLKWLDRYLDYDFLALGGMVKNDGVESWLDSVWNHIYKRNPSMKVHGFGMTDIELMMKYPWTSVDSSSYAGAVRWARVTLFDENHGIIYDESAYEFGKRIGHEYLPGEPIVGAFRRAIITAGMESFRKLMRWVNNKIIGKDFSYLAGQLNVFDLEVEMISPSPPGEIIEIHPHKREILEESIPEFIPKLDKNQYSLF